MGDYNAAIARFNKKDRAKLEEALRCWSMSGTLGRTIVRNLEQEHFLPISRLKALLDVILEHADCDIDELAESYEKACWKHVLKGRMANPDPAPVRLGRAVEYDTFADWLFDKNPDVFEVRHQAFEFIRRLVGGKAPTSEQSNLLMSTYISWVTWRVGEPAGDPFHFATKKSADDVRANLGLNPRARCKSNRLLLLIYHGRRIALYRPTIADAGRYLYFSPPARTESRHGYTFPWQHADAMAATAAKTPPIPRPEAIHRAVTLERIIEVRELK